MVRDPRDVLSDEAVLTKIFFRHGFAVANNVLVAAPQRCVSVVMFLRLSCTTETPRTRRRVEKTETKSVLAGEHNSLLREPDPGSPPSTDTVRKIAEVVACQVVLEISRIEMICQIENL